MKTKKKPLKFNPFPNNKGKQPAIPAQPNEVALTADMIPILQSLAKLMDDARANVRAREKEFWDTVRLCAFRVGVAEDQVERFDIPRAVFVLKSGTPTPEEAAVSTEDAKPEPTKEAS